MVDRQRPDELHLVVERELRRDDVLRELVGDDRGDGDGAEREPLGRAGGERARRVENGVSPSVAEPTRTSSGVRAATSPSPRSSVALAVDAEARPRPRLQSLLADRLAARSCRCRTCRPRCARARRRSARGPAPSAPRACSRSRGRASPAAASPRWLSSCRAPPRSRPRASPGVSRCRYSIALFDALALVEQGSAKTIGVHVSLSSPAVGEQALGLRLLEAVQHDDLVPRRVSGNERDARRAARRASWRGGAAPPRSRGRPPAAPRRAPSTRRRDGRAIPGRRAPGETRSFSRVVAADSRRLA